MVSHSKTRIGHRHGRKSLLACLVALVLAGTQPAFAQTLQITLDSLTPDVLLDTADTTTGWATDSANTLSVDTEIKVLGTASLKSVGSARDRFRKLLALGTLDVSKMHYLTFWYYVDRPDLLGTTSGDHAFDFGQVEITSSGTFDSREWSWSVYNLHLQRGWNYVVLDLPGRNTSSGSDGLPIDPTTVNYMRIYHRPTASVTTRIDHVVFTNREPASYPFAQLVRSQLIAQSPQAVQQYDGDYQFMQSTVAGGAERARYCRRLTIDLQQRQINYFTLQSMGVPATLTTPDLRERQLLKQVMCGTSTLTNADLQIHLQNRAAADIAITRQLMTLLDITAVAAAETRVRLFDADLRRIMNLCSSSQQQLADYILTGRLPPFMSSTNVLTAQCTGLPAQIAGQLDQRAPLVTDRRAIYQQCMAVFENQSAQCDNTYTDPDRDAADSLSYVPGYDDAKKAEALRHMKETIRLIEEMTLDEADTVLPADKRATTGAESTPEERARHEAYDLVQGKIQAAKIVQETWKDMRDTPRQPEENIEGYVQRVVEGRAMANRLQAEIQKLQQDALERYKDICRNNPNDKQCVQARNTDTTPAPANPKPTARCANVKLPASQLAWFDKPAGADGSTVQIKEPDRIDHCLCQLFDRDYPNIIPGSATLTTTGCPTPEERVAQDCLANPWDGRDGPRRECRHLLQPITRDRDAVTAGMCGIINPGCNVPYAKDDGTCGCGVRLANGGISVPSCASIPNCPEGTIPATKGCGCQPLNTGANLCTAGGKDLYLVKDPANDLLVRRFPNKPNYATTNILVARPGSRFVVPAVRVHDLRSSTALNFRAVLTGSGYDGTGNIKILCSDPTTGVVGLQSRLIKTMPLSSLSTDNVTSIFVSLLAADRNACFGQSPNNKVNFEVSVESTGNQSVGFFDPLDELTRLKPACINLPRPNPGPRPSPVMQWIGSSYTFHDGSVVSPLVFNGVGAIPPLTPPSPTLPLCRNSDGILVPCP